MQISPFHIYLPIAELSVDPVALAGLGAAIGFLSGLFGVGGGFLVTPLLIFMGVPPSVAAATGANTVIAPAVAGLIDRWRKGGVDLRMGGLLLAGGVAGSGASVALVGVLQRLGQIDLVLSLAYVVLLGSVGTLMLREAAGAIRRRSSPLAGPRPRLRRHGMLHGLPWRMRFPASRLYASALFPVGVGTGVGALAGLMGVGGGFLLVPAMIYGIGMPTAVVVGTSQFQIVFVSAAVTLLHAYVHHNVDVVLASVLALGAVVATPFGTRLGQRLAGPETRALMALLVLAVALALGAGLVLPPEDVYSLKSEVLRGSTENYQ